MADLVNLGSLCIDIVYSVPRITRHGETVTALKQARFVGGKGLNQSLAAARAGCRVAHHGCVGNDGGFLVDALREAGVDARGVRIDATSPSGQAVIQVDQVGANAIVIVGGANRCLVADDIAKALASVAPHGWLLLQNEVNAIDEILASARRHRVRVAMNLAPADGRERGYDLDALELLVMNSMEAQALTGEEAADRAIDAVTNRHPALAVVVTLGENGLVYGAGAERLRLGAFHVDAVDETAAGDAFMGYLMHDWIDARAPREALVRASAAGAIAVTKPGAASSIPHAAEVERFLNSRRHELE